MEWQPIETSPMLVPILITNGDIVMSCVILDFDDRRFIGNHGFFGYEFDFDFEFKDATHWMPLPEAPKKEAA